MRHLPLLALLLLGCGQETEVTCAVGIDGVTSPRAWFKDVDGDGYGTAATVLVQCAAPDGYVELGTDCDDGASGVNPGRSTDDCDGADADCDGEIDEDGLGSWYLDRDGDGFGDGDAWRACDPPAGHVDAGGDCDDADPDSHPGAVERCDGADNDCNGSPDEVVVATCHPDLDDDGFGDAAGAFVTCEATCPAGSVEDATDCDDTRDVAFPGADEDCDGIDNDCDPGTFIDEGSRCNVGADPVLDPVSGHVFLPVLIETEGELAGRFCTNRGYHLAWFDDAAEAARAWQIASDAGATIPLWTGARWDPCGDGGGLRRVDGRDDPPTCAAPSAYEAGVFGAAASGGLALDASGLIASADFEPEYLVLCEVEP